MPRVLVELEVTEKGVGVIGQTTGSLKNLDQQAGKTRNALSSIFQGIGQAVGQRAFAAIEALPRFLFDSMKAAGEAERGVSALNLALANQGRYSAETSRALQDHASALAAITTFTSGAIIEAETIGAQMGLNEEQIQRATKAALDLSAATGKDLNASMELLGKAYAGNTTGLGKMGIKIDENLTKTQKFDAAVAEVERRFGGSAVNAANGFAGGLEQLENATDDVKESLGFLLGELLGSDRPFGVATDAARGFADFLRKDMSVALSEFRARYLETMADIIGGVAGETLAAAPAGPMLGLASMLGISGSDKKELEDYAKSLRQAADGLREVNEAEQAGIRTKDKYTNNTRQEAAAVDELTAAFDRKSYTLQIQAEFNRLNADIEEEFDRLAGQRAKENAERYIAEMDAVQRLADAERDEAQAQEERGAAIAKIVTQDVAARTERDAQAMRKFEEQVWNAVNAVLALVGAFEQGRASGDRWQGTAMGVQTGMQAGSAFGSWGAAIGAVAGGIAGYFGGKEGEKESQRVNALNRINEYMDGANAVLARLEEIRRKTQEVVAEGAQGLAAMFESATSPEDFERLGRLALAGVEAMKAQGFSMLEIFRALRPALDAARERLQELGKGAMTGLDKFTGEEVSFLTPFEELLAFDELIQANEGLIASIEGTGAVLRMLQETGNLTGQSLTDILTQVAQDYDKLIAQGFTRQQALAIQADSLRELNRLQEAGLITVDALTQARIDEAKAAGLLDPTPQEQIKELMDLQLLVLVAQALMLGVTLPAAVQTYIDSLNRVPTRIQTEVIFDGVARPGSPGSVTASPTNNNGTTMGGLISAASGFGPRRLDVDTMFLAHAGEHVLIVPAGMPFGFQSAADGFADFKTPIDAPAKTFGGGGSAFKTFVGDGGSNGSTAATSSDVQTLAESVRELAARPASFNVTSSPTVVVEDKSLVKNRDGQEAFARMVIPVIDRALRLNQEGLASRVKQIASAK